MSSHKSTVLTDKSVIMTATIRVSGSKESPLISSVVNCYDHSGTLVGMATDVVCVANRDKARFYIPVTPDPGVTGHKENTHFMIELPGLVYGDDICLYYKVFVTGGADAWVEGRPTTEETPKQAEKGEIPV